MLQWNVNLNDSFDLVNFFIYLLKHPSTFLRTSQAQVLNSLLLKSILFSFFQSSSLISIQNEDDFRFKLWFSVNTKLTLHGKKSINSLFLFAFELKIWKQILRNESRLHWIAINADHHFINKASTKFTVTFIFRLKYI